MTTRMLIDATHAEETRIVVVDGKKLIDFDFETATKRQLKGNIYLAKVTRVEPSLQAAFVDYGGNRHGFLAFNEIHPDYYQIPIADREALLADEAEQAARQAELEDRVDQNGNDADDDADDDGETEGLDASDSEAETDGSDAAAEDNGADGDGSDGDAIQAESGSGDEDNVDGDADDDAPEASQSAGAVDVMDEVPRPRSRGRRNYKIQEVIKRRQILLIQVVKEERGNKGAALTTYLSLAGRYSVLMPNTARGGGISRKIANQTARRKLKNIVSDLDVPAGMGVIVRTAGQNRTKAEIRRDFEYLLRLWDSVRDLTLDSTAPTVVYEEADLIKRAIRDMYAKDIDEVLVDGEEGYRVAKDFMRMLMPSHAKKVQPYRERIPLLHRYQVEQQLDSMHSNVVQLKSGGYLVFAQTEALVAVDVNSGRSTKERNIEETALKTNLEAASEIGRQLRLRDLAGLVVIDYIDMDENRNNRAVERRMKDALKDDRARIQVGRISSFGLMELSRQRLRPSLFEASTRVCEFCAGSGFVRTTESTALHVLRSIEEEGIRGRAAQLTVHAPPDVSLYLLNQKREHLAEVEQRYGMQVYVLGDETLIAPDCRINVDQTRTAQEIEEIEQERRRSAENMPLPDDDDDDVAIAHADEAAEAADSDGGAISSDGGDGDEEEKSKERRPRRRRRSRRRGEERKAEGEGETSNGETQDADGEQADASPRQAGADTNGEDAKDGDGDSDGDGEEKPRRRRRGRRGGRRRRAGGEEQGEQAEATSEATSEAASEAAPIAAETPAEEAPTIIERAGAMVSDEAVTIEISEGPAAPEPTAPIGFTASGMTNGGSTADNTAESVADNTVADNTVAEAPEIEPTVPANEPEAPKAEAVAEAVAEVVPAESAESIAVDVAEVAEPAEAAPVTAEVTPPSEPEKPKRKGWWQRGGLF